MGSRKCALWPYRRGLEGDADSCEARPSSGRSVWSGVNSAAPLWDGPSPSSGFGLIFGAISDEIPRYARKGGTDVMADAWQVSAMEIAGMAVAVHVVQILLPPFFDWRDMPSCLISALLRTGHSARCRTLWVTLPRNIPATSDSSESPSR